MPALPCPSLNFAEQPLFDAFISYSHDADGYLAPALQSGLERLGRPWYRLRALRIFRDTTNLSLNPDLWGTIEWNLSRARWLILLLSPEAAASRWVAKEIAWWLAHRGPESLLLVLTSGELAWIPVACGFDPVTSTALPRSLVGAFAREPLWLDLRWWATDPSRLTLAHVRFRSGIVAIAAAVRGVDPDTLDGEAVRTLRRNRIWAGCASGVLVLAAWSLVERYRLNTTRMLGEAQALARTQPTEALLLFTEIGRRWLSDDKILPSLSKELLTERLTVTRHSLGKEVGGIAWAPDGGYAAASVDGRARLWGGDHALIGELPAREASTPSEIEGLNAHGAVPLSRVEYAARGRALLTEDWHGCVRKFELDPTGVPIPAVASCLNAEREPRRYQPWAVSPEGTIAVAADGRLVFHGEARAPVPIAPAPVDEMLYDGSGWLYLRWRDGTHQVLAPDAIEVRPLKGRALRVGRCEDGRVWVIMDGEAAALHEAGRVERTRLFGRGPWTLSRGCSRYLDGDGNVRRVGSAPSGPCNSIEPGYGTGVAENWQYDMGVTFAFSPGDQLIAVGTRGGEIRVFELETGRSFMLRGHRRRVAQLAFDNAGRRLLSGGYDKTVRVFSLADAAVVDLGQFENASAVYTRSDGAPVVSPRSIDPLVLEIPEEHPYAVPALRESSAPAAEDAEVVIRKDWRFGAHYVLADGDTEFVGICAAPSCSDVSIEREFRLDIASSGSGAQARVSADGRVMVVADSSRGLYVWDTRRPESTPTFTLLNPDLASATVDARGHWLYVLSGGRLSSWPIAVPSIAKRIRERVAFCLSSEERQLYLGEWGWLAQRRAASCQRP